MGGAVDGLADDVGVAGVPRGLLDQVQQDPADRPLLDFGGDPLGVRRDGHGLAEVGYRGDDLVRLGAGPVVPDEQVGQVLLRSEVELSDGRLLRRARGALAPQDEVHPAALAVAGVLDQAGDVELAGAGRRAGLLLGEPVGADAQPLALLGEEGEQCGALVGDGWGESGHAVAPFSAGGGDDPPASRPGPSMPCRNFLQELAFRIGPALAPPV